MESKIMGYQCQKCGKIHYPFHLRCSSCGARDFELCDLPDEGVLLTFTRLSALPEGYDVRTLNLGIVELSNGVRVTGQVLTDNMKIGMKVKVTVGTVREIMGEPVAGFQFLAT
ncbi:uncharacterized protein HKBW3S43_00341 [Candidatus Hakubella thermalkaliphila]|uniref:DUF35 domain-containing protein n=1 Tax=Candidatus Hakubella thermalkaliphila TaxID=2754717 RepID=A0A6V8PQE0_9ACTN|nr:OB-fold domain-containing protein [Candidatus Hakubella thermalkaliphila]GFP24605.1 uncharacterized protein HKBW3S25_00043 [Candidatus Hakubella thermalkaliphila]GFP34548.1 uncharacterized protein HKBW3S43_00341 [Candidatus Hakubella thermalkaliphila]GFP41461.1 uncharacterized protein HKBW3C_00586 [Candidatus Hakubella thermalkaliphila]